MMTDRVLAFTVLCCAFVFLPGLQSSIVAQSPDYATKMASVDEQHITKGEVDSLVKKRLGNRKLTPMQLAKAQAFALDHLIDRRVIYDFLVEKGYAPGKNKVELEISRMEEQLKSAGQTLAEFAEEKKITLEHFRFEAAWRLAWKAYLDEKMTDSVLEAYFQKHKVRFDGTKMKVAQLFKRFKNGEQSRDSFIKETEARLKKIRDEVLSGAITWDEVVADQSDAPSRNQQGLVGWIEYKGPMPPEFTKAAFQLKTGELSEPVVSPFGLHLIRCIDVEAGKMGFRDAYRAVKDSATEERFHAIVDYHRPNVKVTRHLEEE